MTTTHSRLSLKTSKVPDVEFQRLLKGSFDVIQVTDELHDIDKMTGGEFFKMDREDSSADHTPIGSSDSETHGTKEG